MTTLPLHSGATDGAAHLGADGSAFSSETGTAKNGGSVHGRVAVARRQRPGMPLGPNAVSIGGLDLAGASVAGARPVALTSATGRQAVATATMIDEDDASVRLGSLLWRELGVRPGEAVTVAPAPEEELQSVIVCPPLPISHRVEERLADRLRIERSLVRRGCLLQVALPRAEGDGAADGDGATAMVCRIVGAAPTAGRVGPGTAISFVAADHATDLAPTTYADIGGLALQAQRLRELVELPIRRPDLYRAAGINPPRGVLLFGPPGCGKTLMVRALISDLDIHVVSMSGPDLVRSYAGETEAQLRKCFAHAAEDAPSIIAIDEIDALAPKRDSSAGQSDVRMVAQLLGLMDGIERMDGVVVVATTNRPWAIDDALRRPGRFDEEIQIGLPSTAERREILSVHTREMPFIETTEQKLDDVAARAGGCSGADLQHLVRLAGLAALGRAADSGRTSGADANHIEVRPQDFDEALRRVRPSNLRSVTDLSAGTKAQWGQLVGIDGPREVLASVVARAVREPQGEGVLLFGPPGNGKTMLAEAVAEHVGVNCVVVDAAGVFSQWLGESESTLRTHFQKAQDSAPCVIVVDHLDALAPTRATDRHSDHAQRRVLAALVASIDRSLRGGGVAVIGISDRPDLVDSAVTRRGRLGVHIEVPLPDADRRRALLQIAGADRRVVDDMVAQSEGRSAAEVLRMEVPAEPADREAIGAAVQARRAGRRGGQ